MQTRYYSLNEYCKNTFHEKVYKLSLNGGMTCPNRDGTLSRKGCFYCSAGGSGDFAAEGTLSIKEQIDSAKKLIASKTDCTKFIAYFQAYTNTYAPVSYLRKIFFEAIDDPQICALSIGTRTDCFSDEIYKLLDELNHIKPVWVELGLQTMHQKTLDAMNTKTRASDFSVVAKKLHALGIKVIAHLILGLPQETKQMMLDSVDFAVNNNIFGIKLQLLHVLKGTPLADLYETKLFRLFSLEEYCNFVVDCIERIPPNVVIHRMTGDGPRSLLVAPTWSTDKKRVLNTINHNFKTRDTWQGKLYRL